MAGKTKTSAVAAEASLPPLEEPVTGRVLIVETHRGAYRITIPGGARVTFGPLVPATPGGKRGWGGGDGVASQGGTALRIYRGANKEDQIAVFRDVVSFRDVDLRVEKRVIDEEASAKVVNGPKGSKTIGQCEAIHKWIEEEF